MRVVFSTRALEIASRPRFPIRLDSRARRSRFVRCYRQTEAISLAPPWPIMLFESPRVRRRVLLTSIYAIIWAPSASISFEYKLMSVRVVLAVRASLRASRHGFIMLQLFIDNFSSCGIFLSDLITV